MSDENSPTEAEAPQEGAANLAVLAGLEPAAIRQQLDSVLASPHFRNSRRYPAFLRYVVERTLEGASSELKERTIAVEVFGREPDYDPSLDPVVRITAGEVRKRLAQYYQETAHRHEIRIALPLGSYLPEFSVPANEATGSLNNEAADVPKQVTGQALAPPRGSWRWLAVASAAGILAFAGTMAFRAWNRTSALEQFWHPVVSPRGNTVILCFGGTGQRETPGTLPSGVLGLQVPWWDAVTLARLSGTIQAQGARVEPVHEDEATFEDFQRAPAVLIGAFNDAWTLRLMEKMRFTFRSEGGQEWISDREHPERRDWQIDLRHLDGQNRLTMKEDYAVISRVENPRTRRITITVAGLFGYGTLAAGKFLTDPANLQAFAQHAPAGWQDRNMQIVIRTEVIQQDAGPPTVVATAFW